MVGEQLTLQRGFDITRASQREGEVPVISSSGISSHHDTASAVGPGVVLGRKGVVGSVFYVKGDYWPHDTTLWVKDFKGNSPRFVYYFFKSMASQLSSLDVGSANPTLNRNHVHPIETVWPGYVEEQQSIANTLGALDDKIEQNRRTAQALERVARAIFRAWFVDFEPVKAKAAGATSFPSMPQSTFDMLPNTLVDSKIGATPSGWKINALSDLCAINPSRSLKTGQLSPYLDMKNMPTSGHAPEAPVLRTFGSGAKFANGDTLVARITPCLENGKTAFVDFLSEGEVGWGSTEYIVLRPHAPLPAIFAYLLARTAEFRSHAIQAMTGTSGRQRVPFSAFEHFYIAQPPAYLSDAFAEIVNPLILRSSVATRESRKLAGIRDLLLPHLLSGRLRVETGEAG